MDATTSINNWHDARDALKRWREDNERKSEEVVDLWINYLGANSSSLGDEKWMVLEQVAVAALDIHNMPLADDLIMELKNRFPKSQRVKILQVCRLQALNRNEEAIKGLESIILKDPTNSAAYKRKIAIVKGQGRNTEAIKELTEYLSKFMSDQEAWSELCDLYLAEGDYSRAVFCAEELLLHTPHNFFAHQRVADIRYTMGGIDNLKIAVSYYAQACKLNSSTMRALCGMFLAASNLASNPRMSAVEKKEYSKIMTLASKDISNRYTGICVLEEPKQTELLESVFGQLQIQG